VLFAICHQGGEISHQLDLKYRPLLTLMRGRHWLLTAHALRLPEGMEGNIFRTPDGDYYVTVVNPQASQLAGGALPSLFQYDLPVEVVLPSDAAGAAEAAEAAVTHCYLLSGDYFGVNESILQNDYDEQKWNAFYEGKIEPFALQLGLVLTNLFFSDRERALGNAIVFSSNRLQYASNATKLNVVKDLSDRGYLSNYQACDIFNLPYPKDAVGNVIPERWIIRGEYIDVSNLPTHTVDQAKSYMQPNTEPASTEE
jgi:hypothetical protein